MKNGTASRLIQTRLTTEASLEMERCSLKSIESDSPVEALLSAEAMPGTNGLRTRGSIGKRAMASAPVAVT